jgi:hypothetical protein
MPKHFGRPVSGIVITGHGKAIGTGIVEAQDVTF